MKKQLLTLALVSVSALSVAACTNRPTDLPPGSYEKTSTSTDANGTTRTTTKSTDVTVDEYGNKKAVVKSKSSTDPKGLFNKSTSESEAVYKD